MRTENSTCLIREFLAREIAVFCDKIFHRDFLETSKKNDLPEDKSLKNNSVF
jgi:hypothetical protein